MNNKEPIWQQHQFFMAKAIELAELAYQHDEVPVGAWSKRIKSLVRLYPNRIAR